MNYKVFAPHDCHTEVELPASKSISNRALVINALCDDSIPITNVSNCDDTRVMKQAFARKTVRSIYTEQEQPCDFSRPTMLKNEITNVSYRAPRE